MEVYGANIKAAAVDIVIASLWEEYQVFADYCMNEMKVHISVCAHMHQGRHTCVQAYSYTYVVHTNT